MKLKLLLFFLFFLLSIRGYSQKLWKNCISNADILINGNHEDSIINLNKLIQEQKVDNWIINGFLAYGYHKAGDYKLSNTFISKAIKQKNNFSDFYFLQYLNFLLSSNIDKAYASLLNSAAINPSEPAVNLSLSWILMKMGKREDSLYYFKNSLAKEKNILSTLFVPDYRRGIINLLKECLLDYPYPDEINNLTGKLLYDSNLYIEAEKDLLTSNSNQSLFLKGKISLIFNDENKASNYFDKVLAQKPGNAGAIWEKARILMRKNNFEGALQYINKGLYFDENNKKWAGAHCEIIFLLGRYSQADTEINKLLKSNPDAVNLALAGRIKIELNKIDQAESLCKKAIQIAPIYGDALKCLAEVNKNNIKQANKFLELYSKAALFEDNFTKKINNYIEIGKQMNNLNKSIIPEINLPRTIKYYINGMKNSDFLKNPAKANNDFYNFIKSIPYLQWIKNNEPATAKEKIKLNNVYMEIKQTLPYIFF